MNKNLLFCAILGLSATVANAQSRMVLYEEFTGENCPSCASANPDLDAMMTSTSNAGKVYMIKYMCNIPSSGPFYYMTNTIFETGRQSYYSVPFAPFGTLDGTIPNAGTSYPGFSAYLTQPDVDSAIAKPTAFKINATYSYNTTRDSVTITVHVKAMTAYTKTGANLKLRSALCKTLHFATSPGTNGETEFINTVRGMYPDFNGLSIQNSWAVGDSQTYTVKGAVLSEVSTSIPHTASDSTVVVWVQNNTDKYIEQTALASRTFPAEVGNVTKSISDMAIYPNPTKGATHIKFNAEKNGTGNINIYNYAGTLVKTIANCAIMAGQNDFSFSASDLAEGLYNIKLEFEGSSIDASFTVTK